MSRHLSFEKPVLLKINEDMQHYNLKIRYNRKPHIMTSEEILKSDYLHILFDGRNQAYGAFILRKEANGNLLKGLLFALSLTVWLILWQVFYQKPPVYDNIISGMPPIYIQEISPVEFKEISLQNTLKGGDPTITAPVVVEHTREHELPSASGTSSAENAGMGNGGTLDYTPSINVNEIPSLVDNIPAPKPRIVTQASEEKILRIADEMPEFPGGTEALYKWIAENLSYPREAVSNGLQGKVICRFVVERDGSISGISIIRDGVGGGAAQSAEALLRSMPAWKPGRQNDKPVRVLFTLPVTFRLE